MGRAFSRFRPSDFRVRSLDGVAEDWPISYDDLAPYYEENDRIMKDCIRRERSMTAGGGMAGLPADGGDPETVCANKHDMYKEDGHWQKY